MKNIIFYILWPVIAGLVFSAVVLFAPHLAKDFLPQPDTSPSQIQVQAPSPQPFSFKDAIAHASPAVVSINAKNLVNSPGSGLYLPEQGRILRNVASENSLGSGVIISPDGYIITSYHIFFSPDVASLPINNTVTLSDGRTLEARIVALDENNDLALLKVDGESLPHLNTGPSRVLSVGDVVLAIGNPRNIGQSVSLGIISATLRRGDNFVIQTDAAINPGNSGGALIDYDGNLIGINSTIVSESGGSEGIGFATPADQAIRLMSAYIESGPIAYLGVVHDGLIRLQSFNMSIGGIKIEEVTADGPAELAGIRAGDIITEVNDIKVDIGDQAKSFMAALREITPGETIDVKVFREGEFVTIPTVFGEAERTYYRIPSDAYDLGSNLE